MDSTNGVIYSQAYTYEGYLVSATAPDGTLLWETALRREQDSYPAGSLALDEVNGTIYLAGDLTFGVALVAALSTDGTPLWRRTFTGLASSVVVDPGAGRVYVTGDTRGVGRPDLLVVGFSLSGRQLWTTTYDGPVAGDEYSRGAVVDPTGDGLYVTAVSEGARGTTDWVTLGVGPDGQVRWATRLDGPAHSSDRPEAIVVDPARGHVLVTGASYTGERQDISTAAYSLDGRRLWHATYPGGRSYGGVDVAVDVASGAVYVTGVTGTGGPAGSDTATSAYTADGVPQWTDVYNGPTSEDNVGVAIAVDQQSGQVLTVGNSDRTFHLLTFSAAGQRQDIDRFGYGRPPSGLPTPNSASADDLAIAPATGDAYVTGRTLWADGPIRATTVAFTR